MARLSLPPPSEAVVDEEGHCTPSWWRIFDNLNNATLFASSTYDPPNLLDGAGDTATVTVTGAALGDIVTGVSFDKDLQGISVTAYVSTTNTVAVRFQNESGGPLDLASGTIRVLVNRVI